MNSPLTTATVVLIDDFHPLPATESEYRAHRRKPEMLWSSDPSEDPQVVTRGMAEDEYDSYLIDELEADCG